MNRWRIVLQSKQLIFQAFKYICHRTKLNDCRTSTDNKSKTGCNEIEELSIKVTEDTSWRNLYVDTDAYNDVDR